MNLRGLGLFALGLMLMTGAAVLVIRSRPADPPQRFADPLTLARRPLPEYPPLPQWSASRPDAARDAWQAVVERALNREAAAAETPLLFEQQLAEQVEAAAQIGPMPDGLLDALLPQSLESGISPKRPLPFPILARSTLGEAEREKRAGNPAAAWRAAQATFMLGHQTFTTQRRLQNRAPALHLMQRACALMQELQKEAAAVPAGKAAFPRDALLLWAQALTDIQRHWQPKMQLIGSTRPAVGDLLVLARHDEDPTFRLAATYALAIARYNPGHRGNLREILATARAAADSTDPDLAAAGRYVLTFSREDLHRLR